MISYSKKRETLVGELKQMKRLIPLGLLKKKKVEKNNILRLESESPCVPPKKMSSNGADPEEGRGITSARD